MTTAKFAPGTTYKTRGRTPRLCTVVDVLTTRNLAGGLVAVRYVSAHDLAGQLVTDRNVLETTIAMGLVDRVFADDQRPRTNC